MRSNVSSSWWKCFYHGTSSGLDPLICYLNLPILIKSKTDLGTVGIPDSNNGKGAVFLLNTGEVGNTQPLVQHFLERCKLWLILLTKL